MFGKVPYTTKVLPINDLDISTYWFGDDEIADTVIIYLHGGPGYANTKGVSNFLANIQHNNAQSCLIIGWDQRLSGESFNVFNLFKELTISLMVGDLNCLIDRVYTMTQCSKVYLMGHSFGTVLGMEYIRKHQNKISGYIGIAQVVCGLEAEKKIYSMYIDERNRQSSLKQKKYIEKIGSPPHGKIRSIFYLKYTRKFLSSLNSRQAPMLDYGLDSRFKKIWYDLGFVASLYKLWAECLTKDYLCDLFSVDIPVLFISGADDYICPVKYIDKFSARVSDSVNHIKFADSGHRVHLENREKVISLIDQFIKRG